LVVISESNADRNLIIKADLERRDFEETIVTELEHVCKTIFTGHNHTIAITFEPDVMDVLADLINGGILFPILPDVEFATLTAHTEMSRAILKSVTVNG
jgi:hypothetical protein